MTKRRNLSFLFRQLCWLSLGLCLIAALCAQPLKNTLAYVTSLSATCVNTFVGEEQGVTAPTGSGSSTSPAPSGTTESEAPTVPTVPPSSASAQDPPTGENGHAAWLVPVMLISLSGLALTRKGRTQRPSR